MRDASPGTRGNASPLVTSAPSDVLVRLDRLAEAESSRFSPTLKSRGIDPAAARQVERIRDELIRLGGPGVPNRRAADHARDDDPILRALLLAYPDRLVESVGASRAPA